MNLRRYWDRTGPGRRPDQHPGRKCPQDGRQGHDRRIQPGHPRAGNKKIIGIVPQETGYDSTFPVYETLKKQSGYFGIRNNGATIDQLLEALYLKEKRNSDIRELSGGMKKRFLIAKALVHRPKILVLDEPTAGVDSSMRHTLYDFLFEAAPGGNDNNTHDALYRGGR